MLEARPGWSGRVSAAFNIDTLTFLDQGELCLIGPPELLPFLQEAIGGFQPRTYPEPRVSVKEQVTAWTEVLTYAYFGIPPLQPRFAMEEAKRTIYHTQFDTSEIVHRERAVEALQLYGALLVRLDQQSILPYDFTQRAQSLRATVEGLDGLASSLDEFERQAEGLNSLLAQAAASGSDRERDALNDRLRQAAAHLISFINYLDASAPEDALPLHLFYDRDVRALDAALAHLAVGDAQAAIDDLVDAKTGLHGAKYALEVSYPVYYRHTLGGRNPGRSDLFWGQGRTANITDVWLDLHSLGDKLDRGVTDFDAEAHSLLEKREAVAAAYRDAVAQLAVVLEDAAAMLPKPR
jgi:hypothetical protein